MVRQTMVKLSWELSHGDYVTFTSAGVCVERVPLVTQTAITAKRVLTQLRTRTVVALVHV